MSKKTKTKTRQVGKGTVVGITSAIVIAGAGGYGVGTLTNRNEQYPTLDYIVSTEEIKTANKALSKLKTTPKNVVADYVSSEIPNFSDPDRNGCDTRYDVLRSNLLSGRGDDANCRILSGKIFDEYIGLKIEYDSSIPGGEIDVDHMVPKENAWDSGGSEWTTEQWQTFVDDTDNLIPTTSSINRSKGSKDASRWLPPNEKYQCRYVVKQVAIKAKYELSVTNDERAAMREVLLEKCGQE